MSIVANLNGGKDLLFSYHNYRCHAEIVDANYNLDNYVYFGKLDGYIIYELKTINFDPNNFIAINAKSIEEEREMSNINKIVKNILEGKDITKSIMEEIDDGAYYEVVYGYFNSIVKMDRPTTDFGAITDIVIDNLEDEGADGVVIPLDQAEAEYQPDEYVVGGNHGLALIHNGNFNIHEISKEEAEKLAAEKVDVYCESIEIDESAGRLTSVKIVDEPHGKGIEVKSDLGAVYRYAVDQNDPKYYTPEKILHAVQAFARRNNNDMTKIYDFLKNHTLMYDKDTTARTGLDKAEIIAEPNGEGLKVKLTNGQVYRYTVDTKDPKYNTLDALKNGAEGMWRHGASVDGILDFLDKHALIYARESKEFIKSTHYLVG